MTIKRTINGVDVDTAQEQVNELLIKYSKEKDPTVKAEIHAEIVKLYEVLEKFKPNCPVCISGRSALMSGLNNLAKGNLNEGFHKISASFKSIRVKRDILKAKKDEGV